MWFQDFVTAFNQSYNCQTSHYLGRNRPPNAHLSILLFDPWKKLKSWGPFWSKAVENFRSLRHLMDWFDLLCFFNLFCYNIRISISDLKRECNISAWRFNEFFHEKKSTFVVINQIKKVVQVFGTSSGLVFNISICHFDNIFLVTTLRIISKHSRSNESIRCLNDLKIYTGLFWSYQLNSTANLANLPNSSKWAELAVLFSW